MTYLRIKGKKNYLKFYLKAQGTVSQSGAVSCTLGLLWHLHVRLLSRLLSGGMRLISLAGQTLTQGGESLVKFPSSSILWLTHQEFLCVLIGLVTDGARDCLFWHITWRAQWKSSEHVPTTFTVSHHNFIRRLLLSTQHKKPDWI